MGVDMVLDMPAMDMALDTTDMALDTTAMDVVFMATTDKYTNPYLFPDLLQPKDLIKYQDLSVNQVLSPCHQNGLYHSSSPHECCQFQCFASLISLEMASRKQRIKML